MAAADRRSLGDSLVIAGVGTAVFALLGVALQGMVGSAGELVGCFIGAGSASFAVGTAGRTYEGSLVPASLIVAVTFVSIAAGHALADVLDGCEVGGYPIFLVFLAIVTTSWWLIPSVAGTIAALNWLRTRFRPPD